MNACTGPCSRADTDTICLWTLRRRPWPHSDGDLSEVHQLEFRKKAGLSISSPRTRIRFMVPLYSKSTCRYSHRPCVVTSREQSIKIYIHVLAVAAKIVAGRWLSRERNDTPDDGVYADYGRNFAAAYHGIGLGKLCADLVRLRLLLPLYIAVYVSIGNLVLTRFGHLYCLYLIHIRYVSSCH
jgi:hypothetical protein